MITDIKPVSYMVQNELNQEDLFFKKVNYYVANRYLQRLATKLFGNKESEAGKKFPEIIVYDFRHCSCCYWLPRYKSESASKYIYSNGIIGNCSQVRFMGI